MRTKKEVAEKLEEIKSMAKLEHKNNSEKRIILFLMIGWLEALNFVLKNPIDSNIDFGEDVQKALENPRPIDFSQFW